MKKTLIRQLFILFLLNLLIFINQSFALEYVTGSGKAVASITVAHTINSDSNRAMLVFCGVNDATEAEANVSGVTYNGVSMHELVSDNVFNSSYQTIVVFYLLESELPSGGEYNVVVTPSGGTNTASTIFGVYSLPDIKQSAPTIYDINGVTVDENVSATLTTTSANNVILDAVSNSGDVNTNTPGVNQTEHFDYANGSDNFAGSSRTATTAGEYTNTWTNSGTDSARNIMAMVALAPATARRVLIIE